MATDYPHPTMPSYTNRSPIHFTNKVDLQGISVATAMGQMAKSICLNPGSKLRINPDERTMMCNVKLFVGHQSRKKAQLISYNVQNNCRPLTQMKEKNWMKARETTVHRAR